MELLKDYFIYLKNLIMTYLKGLNNFHNNPIEARSDNESILI
jgi:hypothetical protein